MQKMAHTNLAATRSNTPDQERERATDNGHMPKPLTTGIYPTSSSRNAQATTMALEQYRLQLYNYALNIERFRCPPYVNGNGAGAGSNTPWIHMNPYGAQSTGTGVNRMTALSTISLFPQSQRIFQPEEPKPQHSYIGLIAMAILSSTEMKLVLSDIYQYILDNYSYFRSRGPGWRNSIRHNLSLNDCFIKSGRSANGKGHYWAIHPANMDDFRKGDFRRRKAQRKVRKHMGLSVDDASTDSPSPPPLDLTTPPPPSSQATIQLAALSYPYHQNYIGQFFNRNSDTAQPHYSVSHPVQSVQRHPHCLEPSIQQAHQQIAYINSTTTTTIANMYSQTRKRQFDVASLLAPDVQIVDIVSEDQESSPASNTATATRTTTQTQHTVITKQTIHREVVVGLEQPVPDTDIDADIDVEVNVDVVDDSNDPDPDLDPDADLDMDADESEKTTEALKQVFSVDDNNSYLSDCRRSSFDADPDTEDLEPHNYSIPSTAARSLGSSSSQHEESNSLEECPTASSGTTITPNDRVNSTHSAHLGVSIPKAYIELNHVDPHILSRYYGTYMAAAARRASLEASREKATTTPPPTIEIISHK
ncbi:forkhead box protein K2 [Drosophila subobscura]|uniref:forkhead box protein K2 n=1 Tax=Drosophila subobscura TaxID=7241 RepID=UPI00155AC906|nr:forkhead box protein K2 [Drosophila subobscura]